MAVPVRTAVTVPLASTVATPGSLERHWTDCPDTGCPRESSALAVSRESVPGRSGPEGPETSTEATLGAATVGGGVAPPVGRVGLFGAGSVLLRPAAPGTGVIAGGPVRAVVESAGIHDILTKCIGSANKYNAVYATIEALRALRAPEDIAKDRGKDVDDVAADYPIAAYAASGAAPVPPAEGGTP